MKNNKGFTLVELLAVIIILTSVALIAVLILVLLVAGAGALYYFVLASHVMKALDWFSNNLAFSYTLGLFTGCIIIDFIYSGKLYLKIREYAKNNDITVKYEQLKMHIKEVQHSAEEKYSFLFPFRQSRKLIDYLNSYKDKK